MKRYVYILIFIICFSNILYAYDENLHSKISEKAYNLSNMKQYLKNNLGINEKQKFNGKTAKEWIIFGSKKEDSLIGARSLNHFHNPINNSGLGDLGSGMSARSWAIDAAQNDYSWQKAREYYYQALTLSTEAERDTAYAKMFRSLGQVHLVQDMAVPAHVKGAI